MKPSEELRRLVRQMIAASERGNPSYLKVISHRLFSLPDWRRMAELAKEPSPPGLTAEQYAAYYFGVAP